MGDVGWGWVCDLFAWFIYADLRYLLINTVLFISVYKEKDQKAFVRRH